MRPYANVVKRRTFKRWSLKRPSRWFYVGYGGWLDKGKLRRDPEPSIHHRGIHKSMRALNGRGRNDLKRELGKEIVETLGG